MDYYTIGKGIVTINGADVGNCPEFVFQQETTRLVRMRVVDGVRCPAKGPIIEKKGKLKISLDQWTDDVVELATAGATGVAVVVTQTQDIGLKRVWTFSNVDINPASELPLINESWGILSFEAEVFFDSNGNFMTVGASQ